MLTANGIVDEYNVIRHMVNLETVNSYEGTDIQIRVTEVDFN